MLFLIALTVICLSPGVIASQPALIEAQWTEGFEGGNTAGWSSYPPFEDTAYDYTLLPGRYRPIEQLVGFFASGEYYLPPELPPPERPKDNTYYLLRSYRPNSVSPQNAGVSRKVNFYAGKKSSLSFDYYFDGVDEGMELVVHLAGGDGLRYLYTLRRPSFDSWEHVEIPLRSFRAGRKRLQPSTAIEAVAIVSEIEQGDPNRYIILAVDNIRMDAFRPAGFIVREPKSRAFDHWPTLFSESIFYPGDNLSISAQPQLELTRATATLETLDGKILAGPKAMDRQGDSWTVSSLLQVNDSTPRGPCTLTLSGRTKENNLLESQVRLWILNQVKPGNRPSVLFNPSTLPELKEHIQSKDGGKRWSRIISAAKRARKQSLPTDQLFEYPTEYLLQERGGHSDVTRGLARDIFFNALLYAVEGNEEAGQFAKQGLLFQANMKQWIHPSFANQGHFSYLYVGQTAYYCGITYDLIHDLLTPEQRRIARKGILEKGIEAGFEHSFVNNAVPSHTSNHIAWEMAAPGVAMLAVLPDMEADPEHGTPPGLLLAGMAEKVFAHIEAAMMPDGAWAEEYSYQRYAFEAIMPFLRALNLTGGVQGIIQHYGLDRSYLYPAYTRTGEGDLLAMGDSYDRIDKTPAAFGWMAQQTNDPLLTWFSQLIPISSWLGLITGPGQGDTLSPAEAGLPASRIFPGKGNVVFRTGWEDNDLVLNLRAGPHCNHNQFDQGNFRLWAGGTELVSEAGKTPYYDDPYYWSYFIQPIGHNTILVDNNPESQYSADHGIGPKAFNRYPEITSALTDPRYSWARTELAPVYRAPLERLTRRIHLLSGGVIVIRDEVRSDSGPHRYQWLLHPPERDMLDLNISHASARIDAGKAALDVHVIQPQKAVLEMQGSPIPIKEYAYYPKKDLRPRARLQLSHEDARKDQDFLVVLAPDYKDNPAPESVEPIKAGSAEGVQVLSSTGVKEQLLYAAKKDDIHTDMFKTDASVLYSRTHSADHQIIAAESATRLVMNGEEILSSHQPLDILLEQQGDDQADWVIIALESGRVTLFPGSSKEQSIQLKKGRNESPGN
jgi:hypothetical protein